ncbi:hypothetical protein BDW02DRAFT_128280 [Decorospora gaudefroyi]|uniref:Uncharacterized protein n=1 Tax=Decorospora gaudefroyi TaxID=184978 RepID=A0A6A5KP31_9PLEO|nr:hypothetical protein BDW02DRAFT_128280 [Decorospora gaudefroyi]
MLMQKILVSPSSESPPFLRLCPLLYVINPAQSQLFHSSPRYSYRCHQPPHSVFFPSPPTPAWPATPRASLSSTNYEPSASPSRPRLLSAMPARGRRVTVLGNRSCGSWRGASAG